jgi:hypothetical protein
MYFLTIKRNNFYDRIMPMRNASPLFPHREARCALKEEINAYLMLMFVYVIIQMMAMVHRYKQHSRYQMAGAMG